MKNLQPGNDSPHTVARTADAYRKQGQLDKAIMLCLQELQARPAYSSARVVLGRAYLDRGDYAKAEEEFHRVVALSPDHLRARVHLGQICETQGRADEAIRQYEAALALSPLDPEIHASLMKLRRSVSPADSSPSDVRSGDISGAPTNLPTAGCEGTEGDLFATETLADLYASQGFTDRATNIYRQLLDSDPSREGARAKLLALEGRGGIPGGPQPETADALVAPHASEVFEPQPGMGLEPPCALAGEAGAVSPRAVLISRDHMLLEELECWLRGIRQYREMVAAGQSPFAPAGLR